MRDPLPDWPLFGMDEDVRPALRLARQGKKPLALATLVALPPLRRAFMKIARGEAGDLPPLLRGELG